MWNMTIRSNCLEIQMSTILQLSLEFAPFFFSSTRASTRVAIFPEFDKGLGITGLQHVFERWSTHVEHRDGTLSRALSGSRRCPSRVSENERESTRKKTSTIFHPTGFAIAARGRERNFSLPVERTMPSRPADNYIVQWKITGLNILHVETEMPGRVMRGVLKHWRAVLSIYVNVPSLLPRIYLSDHVWREAINI